MRKRMGIQKKLCAVVLLLSMLQSTGKHGYDPGEKVEFGEAFEKRTDKDNRFRGEC